MPVTFAVALTALFAAAGMWVLSRSPELPDPADPEAEERWLVRLLAVHPRLGSAARSIDRRVTGGVMLAAALTIVFVSALAVGMVFDMVERGSGLARWDRSVADWGSRHATDRSTAVLDAITDLGSTMFLIVLCAGAAIYDYRRRHNADVIAFLAIVLVGVVTINNGLKLIVDRERPDVPHLVTASGSSFPSGHTAAATAGLFAVALVVGRHRSRSGRAIAASVAALAVVTVAASRALLGVHWLTDVVAGVAVGWGWFLLSALAFGGRLQRLGEPIERVGSPTGSPPRASSRQPP